MERVVEFIVNHIELSGTFAVLLIALWYIERAKSGPSLSPQQVTTLLNRDEAIIVDLRDKKEFSEGRITGAMHIPFINLKERAVELEKFKDKKVVLVDKMGQHSGAAGKTLKTLGFVNVSRLQGGIAEWRSSNMPLVKK